MKAKQNLVERMINNNSFNHDLTLDVNEKEDKDRYMEIGLLQAQIS